MEACEYDDILVVHFVEDTVGKASQQDAPSVYRYLLVQERVTLQYRRGSLEGTEELPSQSSLLPFVPASSFRDFRSRLGPDDETI
ncbi:hypothetical protein BH23CHL2_BH23CHL2_24370 [soil metagenome]